MNETLKTLKTRRSVRQYDPRPVEREKLEAILEADPDYIFVVAMGTDLEAAQKTLEDTLLSNPAWNTLTAVREGRFVTLDRELFHLRPNARWAESYQIIYDLLYLEE